MLTLLKSRNVDSRPMPTLTRAVADREDPAVAGQRVAVAVLHVERGLDPRLGVERALAVAADGHAVGPLLVAGRAEGPAEAAVGAVGDDDVAGPHLDGRRRVGRAWTTAPRTKPAVDRPARPPRRPASRVAPAFTRSRPRTGRGRGGARRSRSSGYTGCSGHAQLERRAVGDARAARRSGGTWLELVAQAHVVRAASRPGASGRRRRSSRGEASCARRRRRRGRAGQPVAAAAPAGPPPTTRTS